jgi:hypothetical protein
MGSKTRKANRSACWSAHQPWIIGVLPASPVGHIRQSDQRIRALTRAARDPNDEVRNNATLALGVLARSNAKRINDIDQGTFIAMLNSAAWSDRTKASLLLVHMTADRNSSLLGRILAEAIDSLI